MWTSCIALHLFDPLWENAIANQPYDDEDNDDDDDNDDDNEQPFKRRILNHKETHCAEQGDKSSKQMYTHCRENFTYTPVHLSKKL